MIRPPADMPATFSGAADVVAWFVERGDVPTFYEIQFAAYRAKKAPGEWEGLLAPLSRSLGRFPSAAEGAAYVFSNRLYAYPHVYILDGLRRAGLLSVETACHGAPWAWQVSGQPTEADAETIWRPLFEFTGYVKFGQSTERPAQPLTLYRGATTAARFGWAWTPNRSTAAQYAGHGNETGATVWKAVVEPWRLFCDDVAPAVTLGGGFHHEIIIDTAGLEMWPADESGHSDPHVHTSDDGPCTFDHAHSWGPQGAAGVFLLGVKCAGSA